MLYIVIVLTKSINLRSQDHPFEQWAVFKKSPSIPLFLRGRLKPSVAL
jgi:hypothetical protein